LTYSELHLVAESSHGHVSNVKLFDYLDQARKEWYYYCILIGVEAMVVHISTDYKKEVFHNDKLFIRTWIDCVGNTSFTIKQTIVND
jgi:acyl-CoA thioesterase FadM